MNGGRPLFFSGGSALRALSQYFAFRKFPSIHLVTTFDSGGSTAALRKTFALPAVGDLRNRLLALADPEKTHASVLAFCNTRLPLNVSFAEARRLLQAALASPLLLEESPEEFRVAASHHLRSFLARAPADFDARGASLGNVLLVSAWLENGGDLESAVAFFTSLLHICGSVAPIVTSSLHLGAFLTNGEIVIGQHNFPHLSAPISSLFLTVHESGSHIEASPIHCHPPLAPQADEFLREASLICYPMGSFYSSILANLLPRGAGRRVAASRAPKIFIPNTGKDAENRDLGLAAQARRILDSLLADEPQARIKDLLNYVAVDLQHGQYPGNTEAAIHSLKDMGIKIIDRHLVRQENPRRHIPEAIFGLLQEIMDKGEPS